MSQVKNYNLAVALLNFKTAYNNLVKASTALPDLDLTTNYPFFMLDFEEIAPAVLQWCSVHAAKLMKDLPNKVDNPACLSCKFFRAGITPGGICIGASVIGCTNYPTVIFSKELALPVLSKIGIDASEFAEEEVHLLYLRKIDDVVVKLKGE